jgi:hypothetical protein
VGIDFDCPRNRSAFLTRERIVKHLESSKSKKDQSLAHRAIFPPKMNACCGTPKSCATQTAHVPMIEERCNCCDCDLEAERWDGMA